MQRLTPLGHCAGLNWQNEGQTGGTYLVNEQLRELVSQQLFTQQTNAAATQPCAAAWEARSSAQASLHSRQDTGSCNGEKPIWKQQHQH